MGWSISYDPEWQRDVGYSVPAICDYPRCNKEIDAAFASIKLHKSFTDKKS